MLVLGEALRRGGHAGIQLGEPVRVGDRFGIDATGRVSAMPWYGRCSL